MERLNTSHNLSSKVLFLIGSGVSFMIYLFVYHVFKYRYAVVVGNLSKSFPEKSPEEIKVCARNYYRHLGDLIIEPLLFVMVNAESRIKLANYTNTALLDQFYNQGSNVVLLASHCGNWEYLINLPKAFDFRTYTAYTPLSNKTLDRAILKLRSSYGVQLLPKKYFFRGALSALKTKSEPSMIVVIADQRPAPGSVKNFVNFLQQPTHVQIGAERLAQASGAAVLFLDCVKTSRFHYDYTFREVTDHSGAYSPMEITEIYYRMLSDNIIKSPSNWLWSHKRWKHLQETQEKVMLAS